MEARGINTLISFVFLLWPTSGNLRAACPGILSYHLYKCATLDRTGRQRVIWAWGKSGDNWHESISFRILIFSWWPFSQTQGLQPHLHSSIVKIDFALLILSFNSTTLLSTKAAWLQPVLLIPWVISALSHHLWSCAIHIHVGKEEAPFCLRNFHNYSILNIYK